MTAMPALSNTPQRSVYNYARRPILRTGLRPVQLFLVINVTWGGPQNCLYQMASYMGFYSVQRFYQGDIGAYIQTDRRTDYDYATVTFVVTGGMAFSDAD